MTGFSTTLNGLPANLPIWVRIAARNGCSAGTYGPAMLIGGPALPNTGIGSQQNNTPWYILTGILVLSPFLRRPRRV